MIKLPLVGAAYKMQAQSMSCQNCINWYPQAIEYPNGQRVSALMPTPGLKKIFQGVSSAVRCLYVLSNGTLLAVIGSKLYHSKANKFELTEVGTVSALGTVRIADNGQVAVIVNGTYTYALDLKKLTLSRLSGSTIPRSTHVLFLDGRFVVNKANTGRFFWSDLYSTTVNALSYATAESTPDNITAIITFNRELWLFGSQSIERYYGTGSSNSPFSRLSGGAMAFGCVAPDSIVSLSTGVIWLGVSEFGANQIVMSAGSVPERISTHAIEEEIASFSKTSDANAYAYQSEGHVFYVISFPAANVTFCFDVSTGLWHQRSFMNAQGLHERHRSQHHAYFNNMHIVGDYRNGKLYQMDNNIFTDDGELILRERTAQAVITEQKLTRFNQLQIVCETGFSAQVTGNVDPEPPGPSGNFSAPYDVSYEVEEVKVGHVALFKVDPMQKYKLKINGEYVTRLDGSTEFENIHWANQTADGLFMRSAEHFVSNGLYVMGIYMPEAQGHPVLTSTPAIMFGVIEPCRNPFTFELEGLGIERFPDHEQSILNFFRGAFRNPDAEITSFQTTQKGVKFEISSIVAESKSTVQDAADTTDIKNVKITYASNEWSDGEKLTVNIYGRSSKSNDGISTDWDDLYKSYDVTLNDPENKGFGQITLDISDVNFQSKNFHTTTDGDTVNNYVLLTAEIETARTGNIVEDVSLMIDIGLMEESEPMLSNGIVTYSIATANVFKNMAMMVNFSNTGTGEDIALLEPQDKKYTYSQIGRQMKISVDLNGVQRNPYQAPVALYLPAEDIETSKKLGIATTPVYH